MATVKQTKAFKEVLNGSTITSAMKKAGYAETTASTTGKLTNTDGWQELMQKYLPDSKLVKKHNQFLNSEREEIGIKALDMSYKLKGSYAPEKSLNLNLEFVSEESLSKAKAFDEWYKKQLGGN